MDLNAIMDLHASYDRALEAAAHAAHDRAAKIDLSRVEKILKAAYAEAGGLAVVIDVFEIEINRAEAACMDAVRGVEAVRLHDVLMATMSQGDEPLEINVNEDYPAAYAELCKHDKEVKRPAYERYEALKKSLALTHLHAGIDTGMV